MELKKNNNPDSYIQRRDWWLPEARGVEEGEMGLKKKIGKKICELKVDPLNILLIRSYLQVK